MQGSKTIRELAREAAYPPSLFARCMLEGLTTLGKKGLTKAIKSPEATLNDPSIVLLQYRSSESGNSSVAGGSADVTRAASTGPPTRLAREVREAINCDPLHGPDQDARRHLAGIEYELALEHQLTKMGTLAALPSSGFTLWNSNHSFSCHLFL
jgi:hypothetical protein